MTCVPLGSRMSYSISKLVSWPTVLSISCMSRAPFSKMCTRTLPPLPCSDSVDSSPGNPSRWSPCRWLINTSVSREKLRCCRQIDSWAPSPQSTSISFPRYSMAWHDGRCLTDGFADPHPKTKTLKSAIIKNFQTQSYPKFSTRTNPPVRQAPSPRNLS